MTLLEGRVQTCQDAYYNGQSVVSDAEFDRLTDKLRRENPYSPVLEAVGAPAKGPFPKAPHIIPMGSLNKVSELWRFNLWANRISPASYVVQYKRMAQAWNFSTNRGN